MIFPLEMTMLDSSSLGSEGVHPEVRLQVFDFLQDSYDTLGTSNSIKDATCIYRICLPFIYTIYINIHIHYTRTHTHTCTCFCSQEWKQHRHTTQLLYKYSDWRATAKEVQCCHGDAVLLRYNSFVLADSFGGACRIHASNTYKTRWLGNEGQMFFIYLVEGAIACDLLCFSAGCILHTGRKNMKKSSWADEISEFFLVGLLFCGFVWG